MCRMGGSVLFVVGRVPGLSSRLVTGEDRMILASFVKTAPACDGQQDRQTDNSSGVASSVRARVQSVRMGPMVGTIPAVLS